MSKLASELYTDEWYSVFAELADAVVPGVAVTGIDLSAAGIMRAAGFEPDPFQLEFLSAEEQLVLMIAHRQFGKTQCSGAWLAEGASNTPETNWVIASPAFRQSSRVLARIRNMWRRVMIYHDGAMVPPPRIINRDIGLIRFDNESTIIALPDNPTTVRGETAHGLLYEEAAYIPIGVRNVCDFMLGATGGKVREISSAGVEGTPMHEEWLDIEAPSVRRIEVKWWENPRISHEFVESVRRKRSKAVFEQEMECKWGSREGAMFREQDIIAAASDTTLLAIDLIPGLNDLFAA